VTLDDKEVPKEQQFRSFVTEYNKLVFQDIGLPDVEIAITPLGLRGPTIKLKTLVTILGFAAEVLDPSILGVSIFGKAFKVKELTAIQRALKAGDKLNETQLSELLKMDEAIGIAGKERAEADLIKEIEGFGAEPPSGPALEFEKPGRFKRVQADEIPEQGVQSLAARIARDEEGFSADELEIKTNFPEEIEAEFKSLRKGENLAPDEPLPTLTREDVENQVRELSFSKEQTNAQLKLFEARAKAWAQQIGRPADEWYGERIAGIKRSVPEDVPGQVRNEPPERVETAVEGDEVFLNENDELTINGRVLFQENLFGGTDPAFLDPSRATYRVTVKERGLTATKPGTEKQLLTSTGGEGIEEVQSGVFRVPGLTQVHFVRGEKAAKLIFKDNANLGFEVSASQISGQQAGREFKSIDDFKSDVLLQSKQKPLQIDPDTGDIIINNLDPIFESQQLLFDRMKRAGFALREPKEATDVFVRFAQKDGRVSAELFPDHVRVLTRAFNLDIADNVLLVKNMNTRAAREFGLTNDFREAGYIQPNGNMLDFSGKKEGGLPGERAFDHRQITRAFEDDEFVVGMQEFMDMGNIRIMPEADMVDIPKAPTSQQMNKMRAYFEHVKFKKDTQGPIVEAVDGERRFYKEYPERTNPQLIITDIARFYEGKKSSGDVLFQRPLEAKNDASPIFYSTLRNTIEDKMPGRADVTTITGLVKNIKKEEMQWSGLDDYLAGREGDKITKDEVLEFLKENQIRIEETLKTEEAAQGVANIPSEDLAELRRLLAQEDNLGYNTTHEAQRAVFEEENLFDSFDIENPELINLATEIRQKALEHQTEKSRYGEYQLPGGENYKEMLLRLPTSKKKRVERIERIADRIQELRDKRREILESDISAEEKGRQVRNIDTQMDLVREESGFTIEEVAARGGPTPEAFRSPHWEEPNVLAHVRFNERTIVKAERFSVDEKTLFIEEIQSDWMQAGRKRGFADEQKGNIELEEARKVGNDFIDKLVQNDLSIRAEGALVKTENAAQTGFSIKRRIEVESFSKGKLFRLRDLDKNEIIPNKTYSQRSIANVAREKFESRPVATVDTDVTIVNQFNFGRIEWHGAVTNQQRKLIQEWAALKKESRQNFLEVEEISKTLREGVPNAPFKTSWHEMSMRRMIRYAADNNFDRIGWTTGAQQADRYNLSTQIKHIEVTRLDEKQFIVKAQPHNAAEINKTVTANELPDFVGQDLANKIIKDLPDQGNKILYSGDNLKIGGEGMAFFYDKMLVNYAKKFGKKFGAEVEDVTILQNLKKEFLVDQHEGSFFAGRNIRGATFPNQWWDGSKWVGNIQEGKKYATHDEALRVLLDTGAGEEANKIHSMKITDEMKRSVREKGVPLFQDAKGAVEFLEGEQRAIIHLFEGSDFSTILHETAHIFRRELVSADLIKAEKWAGVRDGNWTTEAEEKFARAFERYLREGEAPNSELKKIFEQFKEWLKEIYRVIKGSDIDVNLNDDIRQVFDNLLGGKELGDFTGKRVRRAPSDLPAPITDIIGLETGGIRMRSGTDFFRGELREEISEIRKVLHKKFPGKKIFVDQGGESLDEIATRRGITEDELREELLRIDTDPDKLETFRAQAEEAFQRPVTVNNKGELVIDGTVLFQRDKIQPKGRKLFKRVLFQEAPGLSPGQRQKAIGKLQIEKFSEEAKGVIEGSIKVFSKDIRAQRRGKRSIAVTKQDATQEKQLILDALNGKIKEGTGFNAEKIEALGGAVEDMATRLAKDTKLMDNPVTMHLFTNLFKTFSGGASELGRASLEKSGLVLTLMYSKLLRKKR